MQDFDKEKPIWYNAKDNSERYSRYKEMSIQELGHASNLHQFAMEDIERLEKVYPDIPEDMMKKWEESHKEFVEKTAWIRQMQNMQTTELKSDNISLLGF